jgi:hypothetical protein
MIRYALACRHGHAFEGWFSASADYDDQSARGLVSCPVCGDGEVRKQIMAPAVAGTKAQKGAPASTPPAVADEATAPQPTPQMREMMMQAMGKVRRHVEENFDYMGDRFADEARAIHEGRSEERGIYGEATPREVAALVEDGVQVAALPPAPQPRRKLN